MRLLTALASEPRAFNVRELHVLVYDEPCIDRRTVALVCRLRRKIGRDRIVTVGIAPDDKYAFGYQYIPEDGQ